MKEHVITLRAPAKINLGLAVLGKRKDGYHDLASVLTPIALWDTIRLRLRPSDGLETVVKVISKAKDLPLGKKNNATRAAVLFLDRAFPKKEKKFCLSIEIIKRIPLAGGLGGSGTDGATVILGLNRLLELNWPITKLKEIALEIGSELPFFITGGTCLVGGRGEKVSRIKEEALGLPLLLVLKNELWLTADSFLGLGSFLKNDPQKREKAVLKIAQKIKKGAPVNSWVSLLANDLEHSSRTDREYLASVKKSLLKTGAKAVLLAGAGSTIYGIYPDNYTLEVAYNKLQKVYSLIKIPA